MPNKTNHEAEIAAEQARIAELTAEIAEHRKVLEEVREELMGELAQQAQQAIMVELREGAE